MVRLSSALLFILVAAGCGYRDDFGMVDNYACEFSGLRFETKLPMHRDMVAFNAALARDLLLRYEIVPEDSIDKFFSKTVVNVLDGGCLNADSEETGHCLMGRTYAKDDELYTNVVLYGFFHELMHHWDDFWFGPSLTTQWHWTWNAKREAAQKEWDATYKRSVVVRNEKVLWVACGGPPKPPPTVVATGQ